MNQYKEGVQLEERAVPKAFNRDAAGRLIGLTLEDGRILAADLAVLGIGQAKLREIAAMFPGVNVDERGRIMVDPLTGRAGHPKVWAGGDAISGGQEVVNAAQEGRRAARAMCAALGGAIRSSRGRGALTCRPASVADASRPILK